MNKDAYQQKLQAQLDEWRADIDKLRARAEQAEADTRLELQQQIEALQARHQAAAEKLDKLRQSGEEAAKTMQSGIEAAWKELEQATRSARNRFL
ncbi:MAG: hypothetical protein R3202_06275 [Candidatus Competibacterales bacterium]|nr:hypothetical protein [Candidatus Competibacterales bacterium]